MTRNRAARAVISQHSNAIHTEAFDLSVAFNHRSTVVPARRQDTPAGSGATVLQGIHTPLYGA
jgi:hypothetical protein